MRGLKQKNIIITGASGGDAGNAGNDGREGIKQVIFI